VDDDNEILAAVVDALYPRLLTTVDLLDALRHRAVRFAVCTRRRCAGSPTAYLTTTSRPSSPGSLRGTTDST
jgi:hypothetical protein